MTRKQARKACFKFRQGAQWTVAIWNQSRYAWVHSHPMPYRQACEAVRIHREYAIKEDTL